MSEMAHKHDGELDEFGYAHVWLKDGDVYISEAGPCCVG